MYVHPEKGTVKPPEAPPPLAFNCTNEEYEAWAPLRDAWLADHERYERERETVMGPRLPDKQHIRCQKGLWISESDAVRLYGDSPLRQGYVWTGYNWRTPEDKERVDSANLQFSKHLIYLFIFAMITLVLALARS